VVIDSLNGTMYSVIILPRDGFRGKAFWSICRDGRGVSESLGGPYLMGF